MGIPIYATLTTFYQRDILRMTLEPATISVALLWKPSIFLGVCDIRNALTWRGRETKAKQSSRMG
jgi:hypothetical protein